MERQGCWAPVPGENVRDHKPPPLVVAASYPGPDEHRVGRPLVGGAGRYVTDELRHARAGRRHATWTNRVACAPYLSWDYTVLQVRKAIKKDESLLRPEKACQPRFDYEVGPPARNRTLFAMGKLAFEGLFPYRTDSPTKIHGSLVEQGGRRVIPMVNPAFVLRRKRWKPAFKRAIELGVRWQRGEVAWEEPHIDGMDPKHPPSLDFIIETLTAWRKQPVTVAYDVETDSIQPLVARLRSIQLSTHDTALVIPIRSKQGRGWTKKRVEGRGMVDIPPSDAPVQHYPFFYPPKTLKKILAVVRAFFNDPGQVRLVGLNNWVYDDAVLDAEGLRFLGRRMAPPVSDDLLARRRIADGESPRSLAYQGFFFSVVVDWKAGMGSGWDADTDADLFLYGGRDSAVTARVELNSRSTLTAETGGGPNGAALYENDREMAVICREMRELGYKVDQVERQRLEDHFTGIAVANERLLAEALYRGGHHDLVERVGAGGAFEPDRYAIRKKGRGSKERPVFNINSSEQVRELWYDRWDLPPPRMGKGGGILSAFDEDSMDRADWLQAGMKVKWLTKSGKPSTGDPIIRAYLADHQNFGVLEDWQADVMKALRKVRKARKLIGDKLQTARLLDPSDYDTDGYPKIFKANGKWPVTATWADGILRTGFALGPPVGRLRSGDPYNLQNVTNVLRSMFVAVDGHVLVGADFDQLHLKIIANVWGIPSLIEDFTKGRDPHVTMAELAFVTQWHEALRASGGNPKKGDAKRLRNWGKAIRYTGAYGGSARAIHPVMQKAADDDWNLTNLRVTLEEVESFHATWMKNEPQWKTAWRRALRFFDEHGYVEETWSGRRCYFRDGADLNTKVPNWQILGEETAVAGLATRRIAKRLRELPAAKKTPYTGIVEQCHDAVVTQVPIELAEWAKEMIEEEMNISRSDRPVMYTASADIGHRRKDVA